MDYKELIENMRAWGEEYIVPACGDGHLKCERFCLPDKDCLVTQAAAAIADLLARTEAAEKRAQAAAQALLRVQRVLYDPLIIQQEIDGKPTLRPVKNTSRQDVYRTVLLAQRAVKIPYRWFPVWAKGGAPDDSDN